MLDQYGRASHKELQRFKKIRTILKIYKFDIFTESEINYRHLVFLGASVIFITCSWKDHLTHTASKLPLYNNYMYLKTNSNIQIIGLQHVIESGKVRFRSGHMGLGLLSYSCISS